MTEETRELKLQLEVPVEVRQYFVPIPKEYVEEAYKKDEYLVLIGPQHPGSGHMRLIVRLKGDYIVDIMPDPGYVHRGVEKLSETRYYLHNIPLVERPAIMDAANQAIGYVRALEKLLDLDVPPRAQYIRVILAELCRIGTILYDVAILAIFLGHSTGYMWGFGLREYICEALARISGARITVSHTIPGGVRRDVDENTLRSIYEMTISFEKKLKDFERIFFKNPAVVARLKDVGVLSKEEAIKYGVTGPFLRASGVEYDVRKIEPYEVYNELDWDMVIADEGDSYARIMVRFGEVLQSLNIIRQAIKNIPSGPIISEKLIAKVPAAKRADAAKDIRSFFSRVYAGMSLKPGIVTTLTEASRGTLLYTIVSEGSPIIYRLRMITPDYYNLRGFMEACKGYRLADLPAIYGSFGYFPPSCDR